MTLLKMSFYGAVIILAVLLIRAITLHKLPKKTFLILWAVALVRLLIPFEITSGLSLYSLLPEVTGESPLLTEQEPYVTAPANPYEPFKNYADYLQITDETVIIIAPDGGTTYLPNVNTGVETIPLSDTETGSHAFGSLLVPLFPIIWSTGAFLCVAFFLICYLKCLREFRTALPVTEEYAAEWLKQHPLKRSITIHQSDKISAPLTYGIFHPVILLPKKTDWNNIAQLDYVLYHEFTHIRRFDLLAKLVMITALCFHWFNPFVWVMYMFFNRDLELSCDDCVVKHFNQTKADYANTLIGMEERKNYGTPLCNHFSKTAIEERITAIMKSKKTTASMMIAAVVIISVVIVTLTTGRRNNETIVDITSTTTPTETAAPIPPEPTKADSTEPTPAPGAKSYSPERNYTHHDALNYEWIFEQMPGFSIPTTDGPDWYNAVSELMHGNTPADTTALPYNTVVPDYIASSLDKQAQSYLILCGLGATHHADYYAVCQTGNTTVYAADISYSADYNSPIYFTVYHAYEGDKLVGKVIFRHLITFYDTENLSHVWANYISMGDVVTMAKEQFEAFYASKGYTQPCKITSIHMTGFNTMEVQFLISESDNFEIYTEGTVDFTYDFTSETWSVSVTD